jgi:hypothetical protein
MIGSTIVKVIEDLSLQGFSGLQREPGNCRIVHACEIRQNRPLESGWFPRRTGWSGFRFRQNEPVLATGGFSLFFRPCSSGFARLGRSGPGEVEQSTPGSREFDSSIERVQGRSSRCWEDVCPCFRETQPDTLRPLLNRGRYSSRYSGPLSASGGG